MATSRKDHMRKKRRTQRVRASLQKGTYPRVSLFRSHKNISAQIIDDLKHGTVASFSSLQLPERTGDKKAIAAAVGKELAKKAKEKGIDQVVFDRGPYRYHGRIKAFAEGLREGGVVV